MGGAGVGGGGGPGPRPPRAGRGPPPPPHDRSRKTPACAGVFHFQQERAYCAFWITAHARRAPALPVGWVL